MKKSTLILLLVAAIAGAAIYYLEIKPGKPRDETPEETKSAFNFKREELVGLTLTRGGQKIEFANEGGKWLIKQPLNSAADESAVNLLVGDLVGARVERELTASADELKTFGLAEPAIKLEAKLSNGQTHRIDLGSKDVIGSSAYSLIDGGQKVALIGSSLLGSADKSLSDFRDRSILTVAQTDLSGAKITNENGSFELAKKDSDWIIKSPVERSVEESEVTSLLTDLASAKAAEIVSETSDDLPKYGLDKPKASFAAKLSAGGEKTISFGSKIDDKYYAKAGDRPQIFKVESSLYDKVNTKPATLYSKSFIKLNQDVLSRVQIKNPNLTLTAERNNENKWLIKEPADKKDKEASISKILDPLETKATEVLDKPTAAIVAKLAKPAIEVRLTDKSGKTTVLKVSAADGDNAYIRVEGKPEIYKVGKSMVESLSFKIDEAVSSSQ